MGGRAVEILDEARTLGGDLVFSMPRGGPISSSTLPKMLKVPWHRGRGPRLPAVVPGLGGGETDHPRAVIEAALAHVVPNTVEAAYARPDLFERRRLLMDDWARYLDGERRLEDSSRR